MCFRRQWEVIQALKTQRQWFHLPDHLTQTIAGQLSLIAMQISSPTTTQAARLCLSHKKPHYERSFQWSESIWLQLCFMTELKYKKTLLAETVSSCSNVFSVSIKCRICHGVNGFLIIWTSNLVSFCQSNVPTRWRTGLRTEQHLRKHKRHVNSVEKMHWWPWAVL